MLSRKVILPSPIRTSPLRSRMVTSPACRSFKSSSAIAFSVRLRPLFACLLEAVQRLCFTFVNVEDGQELGYSQQILKFLCEIEQFELSPGISNGSETGDEFTNTARIDVAHARKVQKN